MSMGSGGMDEYQRLIAERAAAQKKKRTIFGVVLVVALGAGVYWWKQQKDKAGAAQAILDAAGRFAEKDKTEMGAFWSCAFGSDIDVGMLSSAHQIQQKIESAYFPQPTTVSDHLPGECGPKLERAHGSMGALELGHALAREVLGERLLLREVGGLDLLLDLVRRVQHADVDVAAERAAPERAHLALVLLLLPPVAAGAERDDEHDAEDRALLLLGRGPLRDEPLVLVHSSGSQ